MILTTAWRAVALVVVSWALIGCGGDDGGRAPGDRPKVAATTMQLADIVRNVADDRAEVVGLLTANADPHDYEPEPSDAEALIDSSLILKSGGDLDAWMDELIDSSGTDAPVVEMLDVVTTIDAPDGSPDPHWWHDPRNAVLAVQEIADQLADVDPEGAEEYEANAERYSGSIERLDRSIEACVGRVPAADRKLVTSHDSLAYLADRYAIEVVGAAIPALTTQAQASAGEVAELVDLIRSEGVPAVFPEAGLSGELEAAIAVDADAEVGGELFADTLGATGSGADTYLGALAGNARTLADGLGAAEAACELPG